MDLTGMNLYVNALNASVTQLKVQRNVDFCFALRHKPDGNELLHDSVLQQFFGNILDEWRWPVRAC